MTSQDYLGFQLEYVVWADKECVKAAATVPAGRFDETFGFSFGSVHATLVHMLGAQDVWLDRLTGDSSRKFPVPADYPTLADIRQRWSGVHGAWRGYLSRQNEEALDASVQYTRRDQRVSSNLRQVIGHVLDHATHHRGQLNSLIKLAGGAPGDYGWMTWSRLHGQTSVL